MAIGAKVRKQHPKNEGNIKEFIEFVEFCKKSGKAKVSLASKLGVSIERPVTPVVIPDKRRRPRKRSRKDG